MTLLLLVKHWILDIKFFWLVLLERLIWLSIKRSLITPPRINQPNKNPKYTTKTSTYEYASTQDHEINNQS